MMNWWFLLSLLLYVCILGATPGRLLAASIPRNTDIITTIVPDAPTDRDVQDDHTLPLEYAGNTQERTTTDNNATENTRPRRDETETVRRAYGRGVGFFVGEPCEDTCSNVLFHVYCNQTTHQCECQVDYPVNIENKQCVKALALGEKCEFSESCSHGSQHSICSENGKTCVCESGYRRKNDGKVCIPGGTTGFLDNSDVTTMVSVISGLIIFAALFCLVLRLFSRARFNRPRDRFGNASAPSVILTGLEAPPSVPGSRRHSRSSASNEYIPASRRASYSMLAPPSNPASRRPSSASVRSQVSVRSYSSFRSQSSFRGYRSGREMVRRTVSSPADTTPTPNPFRPNYSPTSLSDSPKAESSHGETSVSSSLPNHN